MNNAVLYISGDLEDGQLHEFFYQFNKIDTKTHILIYLNSEGGDVGCGQILTDFINEHRDRITLVACGYIFSAAFNLFFECRCKRRISDGTLGMAHFSWATFDLDEGGKPKEEGDAFLMEQMKANKNKTVEQFRKLGLNQRELKKLRDNKEVYFTTQRLKQLLDGQDG
jgi:ATP-dependent protease ClpP protease subunit